MGIKALKPKVTAAFLVVTLTLVLLVSSISTKAHPPSNMELDYRGEEGVLEVLVNHSVGNTSAHYVESVTVTRNGEKVVEEEYEEQPGRRESTYEYDLDAENGDLIEVRAVCNRFGDITGSLKIEGLSSDRESLFRAVLTQETPQLTVDEGTPASARGMAVVWIDPKENTLKYGVGFKELSGPPTAGEFVQLEGEDGIVLPIFGEDDGNETETPNSNSGFLTGKWEDTGGEPLTDELIAAILEGKVYLRFQTELNPEGELLGRLEVLS